MPALYHLFGVSTPFDPQHRFSTSWLLSPFILSFVRLVIALYGIAGIIVKLVVAADESAGASFSYFSNITFWSLSFYFLFAGLHSLSYHFVGRAWIEQWPRWLQLLHGLLYSTIVTFPLLVTIVFWAIQFRPGKLDTAFDSWSNVTRHVLNTVFAIFEIVASRTSPPPWIHLPCVLVFLGGYACIAYITHETEGFYTYGFLDASKYPPGPLAGHLLGIGAGCGGLFIVVRFIILGRLWLVETRLGKQGKFVRRDHGEDENDSWVEMNVTERRVEESKD